MLFFFKQPLGAASGNIQEQKKKPSSLKQPHSQENKVIPSNKPVGEQQLTAIEQDEVLLTNDLTCENYKDRFCHLLDLEEKEHEAILENK